MGVIFKNLSVVGIGADAITIPSNLDMVKALWPPNWYVIYFFFFFIFIILLCSNVYIANA